MSHVRAVHKFARISATKVRPFADLIRGKTAGQAEQELQYIHNRGARLLEKVLKSAVANAEDRGARNPEGLIISEARVDGGPMIKRSQARARGMSYMIRRRTAHIHVAVDAPEVD